MCREFVCLDLDFDFCLCFDLDLSVFDLVVSAHMDITCPYKIEWQRHQCMPSY